MTTETILILVLFFASYFVSVKFTLWLLPKLGVERIWNRDAVLLSLPGTFLILYILNSIVQFLSK